jgi:hypothetical protein
MTEQCPACGRGTRWDNQAEYDQFRKELAKQGALAVPNAILQIFGGIVLIIVPTVVFIALASSESPIVVWWYGAYFVAFALLVRGSQKIARANALRNFR